VCFASAEFPSWKPQDRQSQTLKEINRMIWANTSFSRRTLTRTMASCILAGWAALSAPLALGQNTSAANMVSVKGGILNMRKGPGTHTEVLWELRKGYPLQIQQRQGAWLKVRDFEGDSGWVARPLTDRTPHHVVKSRVANVRNKPSTQGRIVGKAEYGEVLRTQEKRAGWVRVERAEGPSGWISKKLLWGW
jgi:SH3-like domain-containing protein